jgi:hypothetical protein
MYYCGLDVAVCIASALRAYHRILGIGGPRGINTLRALGAQDVVERLLRKVHATDPLHFAFRFLLVF